MLILNFLNFNYMLIQSHRLMFFCFLSGIILLSTSCKKNKDDGPGSKQTIMTINFSNDFINPILGAIVFISDMQGNTLADTSFSGNGKLLIQVNPEIAIPGKFMVTIIKPEMGEHKVLVTMNTYLYAGTTECTLTGNRSDTLGHATISLTNLPALTGPVLYSSSGFFNLTSDVVSKPVMLYNSPDNLYVSIHTTEGPRFKWFTGLILNGTYSVDMDSTQTSEITSVVLPFQAIYFEANITGFSDGNWDSPTPFTCDMVFGDGTAVTSIPVAYPSQIFTGFHTELMARESWESPASWYYHVDGAIPTTFKKINAEVSQMQATTGRLDIHTNGQFEVTVASWVYSAPNKPYFTWNIFGPDTLSRIVLPALSPAFEKAYPELSIDSLIFLSAGLMHFVQPITYSSFLDLTLKSSHPNPMQRLETSTVIWLPLQLKK